MSTLSDELNEICKLSMRLEYGLLNILISEKLHNLQKNGLISRFEIKNNTMYIYCDAFTMVAGT